RPASDDPFASWPIIMLAPGMKSEDVPRFHAESHGDGTFSRTSYRLSLPAEVIDAIISAANVPLKFRSHIAFQIPSDVYYILCGSDHLKLSRRGRKTQAQLARVATLAEQLANALTSLTQGARELLIDATREPGVLLIDAIREPSVDFLLCRGLRNL